MWYVDEDGEKAIRTRDDFLKDKASVINNSENNKTVLCYLHLNNTREIEIIVFVEHMKYNHSLPIKNMEIETPKSDASIRFNNIADGQTNALQVTEPRILSKEDNKIFFKESIAFNNETINKTDRSYTQYILVSNGSKHSMRKLLLKAEAPNSDVNIRLIIFKEDNLKKNRIIVFFADSNDDPNIRYAIAQQVSCNEANFKNASADSLNSKEIKNALDGTTLNIKCLDYGSGFPATEQDTCPKSPENPHEITITHGDATQKVAVYNSTWRSSVCYEILGDFYFNLFLGIV